MWVSWESDFSAFISYSPLGDYAVSHLARSSIPVRGASCLASEVLAPARSFCAASVKQDALDHSDLTQQSLLLPLLLS